MFEGCALQIVVAMAVCSLSFTASLLAQPARPASLPAATRPSLKSPEIAADGRVTFRVWAPQARSVFVLNIGPGGNSYESRSEMTKDARGVWSVTTEPMAADIYQYTFSIDGVATLDPSNPKLQTGYVAHQSQLHVPGNELWDSLPGVEHGAVTRQLYHSDVADDEREFWVYTPPGYDTNRSNPYPTLYLLHGLGDRADSWLENGSANLILDNLIAQGKAVPMVMVIPLGYGTSAGPANGRKAENLEGFSKALLEEVLPRVEKTYHVAKDPAHRAIAGLSMGGGESTYVGLSRLDVFSYVGSFSGAYSLWPAALRGGPATTPTVDDAIFHETLPNLNATAAKQLKLLWIACGTADRLVEMNRTFHDWLTSRNIATTYTEVPGVGHVWPLWRRNLGEFAQLIFKD